MKNRIKEYIDVLFNNNRFIYDNNGHMSTSITSLVLAFASFLMLIQNLRANQELMFKCSILLFVGFNISFVVSYFFKKVKLSSIIITLLVAFVLSIFAVSGGNQGFAILWILMVPIMAINLLGLSNGVIISTYFLIFIFILFCSPLRNYLLNNYSDSFMRKFPVLFLSDYLISLFLSIQKEFYYRESIKKSYVDELTGAYNRRFFMEELNKKNNKKGNFGIIIIDVNGLKRINDTLGHLAGDELISSIPVCFKEIFGEKTKICRIGGDEFAVFTYEDDQTVNKKIKFVKDVADEYDGKYISKVSFSAGYASNSEYNINDLNELYHLADELMYKEKEEYYKRHDRRKKGSLSNSVGRQ